MVIQTMWGLRHAEYSSLMIHRETGKLALFNTEEEAEEYLNTITDDDGNRLWYRVEVKIAIGRM